MNVLGKTSVTLYALGLVLLCGSISASDDRDQFKIADRAFVKAVRDGNLEIVDRLFTCVSRRAYDRALREAARNANTHLFYMIAPFTSPKGLYEGRKSLKRHMKKCCTKHIRVG